MFFLRTFRNSFELSTKNTNGEVDCDQTCLEMRFCKDSILLLLMGARNRNGLKSSGSSKTFSDIESITRESRSDNPLQFWSERQEKGKTDSIYAQRSKDTSGILLQQPENKRGSSFNSICQLRVG